MLVLIAGGAYKEALTAINNTHVQSERLTRKVGDICHVVTEVPERHNPMKDCCPDTDPCRELWIDSGLIHRDNVVYSVIEQCDQSSNTDNGKRLTSKDAEDHRCECRREERFVDTKEVSGAPIHIECEGDGREYAT